MESRIKLLHIGEVKGISRKRVKGYLRLTTSTKQRTPLGGCGKEFSKKKKKTDRMPAVSEKSFKGELNNGEKLKFY